MIEQQGTHKADCICAECGDTRRALEIVARDFGPAREGVAAPLEPSQPTLEQWMRQTYESADLDRLEIPARVAMQIAESYAAAVSKNLQQKLADADQAACTWIKDAELWRKLHKASTEELAKCGKENCFGQAVDGCRRWVSEERLNLEKQKVAEAEYQLGVQKGINEYLRGEITALRETK